MSKKILLATAAVFALLLIAVVYFSYNFAYKKGYDLAYQAGYDEGLWTQPPLPKVVVARYYLARGEIIALNNRTITLSYLGETANFRIKSDAEIVQFNRTSGEQQVIRFEDLKVGQTVEIPMDVIGKDNYQGNMVTVIIP